MTEAQRIAELIRRKAREMGIEHVTDDVLQIVMRGSVINVPVTEDALQAMAKSTGIPAAKLRKIIPTKGAP